MGNTIKGGIYALVLTILIFGSYFVGNFRGIEDGKTKFDVKKDSILQKYNDSLSVVYKKIDTLNKHIVVLSLKNQKYEANIDSVNKIINKIPKKLPR